MNIKFENGVYTSFIFNEIRLENEGVWLVIRLYILRVYAWIYSKMILF